MIATDFDSDTGLRNPLKIEQSLERERLRFPEFGVPFSVLVVDIDRLKQINDEFGFTVGDETIRGVAKAIQAATRPVDLCFRSGGDEFLMILAHASLGKAKTVAEELRRNLSKVLSERITLTVSVGISQIQDASDSAWDIRERAEEACYIAKTKGGNRVEP